MRRWFALLLLLCQAGAVRAADSEVALRSVKGSFDDVKSRIVFEIENRGLVLNYTAHVGDMLDRTGKDLGKPTPIFAQAQVLEFCSAQVSRLAMEADAHNIAFCPYTMAVYTLPREVGKVYVSYRKPPPTKSMRPVAQMLEAIVREALR